MASKTSHSTLDLKDDSLILSIVARKLFDRVIQDDEYSVAHTDLEPLASDDLKALRAEAQTHLGITDEKLESLDSMEFHEVVAPSLRQRIAGLLPGAKGRAQGKLDRIDKDSHSIEMQRIGLKHLVEMIDMELEDRKSAAERADYARISALRESLGANVLYRVVFGDSYGEPTEAEWGIMQIDERDTDENIRAFIAKNQGKSDIIVAGIKNSFDAFEIMDEAVEFEGEKIFRMLCNESDFNAYALEKKGVLPRPTDILSRGKAIAKAIAPTVASSHPGIPKGPTIFIGISNSAYFSGDHHSITVDASESAEENIAFINEVLGAGDPESIHKMLVAKGLFSAEETLSPSEVFNYRVTRVCAELDLPKYTIESGTESQAPTLTTESVESFEGAGRVRVVVRENATEDEIRAFLTQHTEEIKAMVEQRMREYGRSKAV